MVILAGIAAPCEADPAGPEGAPAFNTAVSLLPRQTFITPAELCTLQIAIEEPGDSIGCMECYVSFDTALVTLVAAEEGALFENTGKPTFFRWESIASDTQSVVDCLLGYRTYFLPPGELARFVFRGDQNGTCPVRITFIRLWDIDRIEFIPMVDPAAWIYIGSATGAHPPAGGTVRMTSYPNPFSVSTTITVPLAPGEEPAAPQRMTVAVYNALGQRIATLFDGRMEPGRNRFEWKGTDRAGRTVPSGIYFVQARTQNATLRTKLVLIQ